MLVENDLQITLAGGDDDRVENLEAADSFERGILIEVNAVWLTLGVEQVVGKGQALAVVSCANDLIEHRLVGPLPEPVRRQGVGFHAKPVQPGQPHLMTGNVNDFAALGLQKL